MTELEQRLRTIVNEKETKLSPENIKKGITIFGVEGTLESKYNENGQIMLDDGMKFAYNTAATNYDKYDFSNVINYDYIFHSNSKLTHIPATCDTSNTTSLNYAFQSCSALTSIPATMNTSKVKYWSNAFSYCRTITEMPLLDYSECTGLSTTFRYCDKMVTFPQCNWPKVTSAQNAFQNCTALSNDSLNNIMASLLTSAITSSTYKTLKYIGLTSTQATTCTGLSNWSALSSAGWVTGY